MAADLIAVLETRALWEASADGLLLVDDAGIILATNEALDAQFAYAANELAGSPIESLLPAEHRSAHVAHRQVFSRDRQSRPMASRNLEGQRRDGTTFPVNISLAPVETEQGSLTFAAVRDLTARVEYERTLAEANRRRITAEDHDRIANDLHDSVIQRLFAVGLGLQGLPARIDDPDVSNRVSTAVDTLDEIIIDIRSTIYGLRTSSPHDERLRPMIVSLANEAEPTLGFVPDLMFFGSLESVLDTTLKHHVVSVIREALSNVGRHAGASSVSVSVRVGDQLEIEVIDNGDGLDPSVGRFSGISNMRQRAETYGGELDVGPADGGGTRVRWAIPGDEIR